MEALRGLVDYAGLFPPAQLDLPQATDEYRIARTGSHAWMLGRFIVPLAVLAANAELLRDVPLSVIVEGGSDRSSWAERIAAAVAGVARLHMQGARVELLEVPLPRAFAENEAATEALRSLRQMLQSNKVADLTTHVELPRDAGWTRLLERTLPELARLGLHAKVRCGGVTAAAFPSVDELATFLASTCAAGVAFKATAGLHHPIRHRDASTGFMMHGFLNLLAGAALAPIVDAATLRAVIGEEDAVAFSLSSSGLRWRDHHVDEETLIRTRRDRFVSYGSCSFDEPVDDLITMGVLAR
jgi:hypothetical protein